ncbi:hypothetical protein [Falsiroseomonas sp. CW058]|uniref:hypothetical protein n=1 Tax=Falsiroseomonas sp. CW058 TaxID=3388664 RepID=UPI003D3151B3
MRFHLHVGMPKTGTTSLQQRLHSSASDLAARGVLYPPGWRNEEGIAHHMLGARLLAEGLAEADGLAAEVVQAVTGTGAGHVVLSTESLTNLISSDRVRILDRFTHALSAAGQVDMVICLRRIDEFFESMYLHSVKVGETRESFDEYLARRDRWAESFFGALCALEQLRSCRIRPVVYRRGSDVVGGVLAALEVPPDAVAPEETARAANQKLSLKVQACLLHLPDIAAELGKPLRREALIRAAERGRLVLPDDTLRYSIMPRVAARWIHESALHQALRFGNDAYYQAFRREAPSGPAPARLDRAMLTPEDLGIIAALGAA